METPINDSLTARNHMNSWVIATFKAPCLFNRSDYEVWVFNPGVRYVLNAFQAYKLEEFIESVSDLRGSAYFKPLNANANIAETSIVVQRTLDRGIGDLLFMTGPLAYMSVLTAGTAKFDLYALSDRAQVLLHHPLLQHKTALSGPLTYDSLTNYDYHWLVESSTECSSESTQLNVYDSLFQQLGVDYTKVDQKYKRPTVPLSDEDRTNFDIFAMHVYSQRGIDLRKTPYYVVAPLSHSNLRTMSYLKWAEVISKLQEQRPVIVMGSVVQRMPTSDITPGEFVSMLEQMGRNVINLVSAESPLRAMMAIISNAALAITLDSGLLYVAQALRVPAISVWGSHHPGARLGYDKDYMDLAIWKPENCRHAPCFSFSKFPAHKCPRRDEQQICEVFVNDTFLEDVTSKVGMVEGQRVKTVAPFVIPKE